MFPFLITDTFKRGGFGLFLKVIAWTLLALILAGLLWKMQHFFFDNYDCQSFEYGGSLKFFFMFKSEKAVLLIGMLISRDLGQLLLSLTSVSCGSSVTENDAIARFSCNPF